MSNLAQQAISLRDNEAFQAALDNLKTGALDALARIDADDKNGILKLQATIAVVNDIRSDTEAFIRAGKPKGAPGLA